MTIRVETLAGPRPANGQKVTKLRYKLLSGVLRLLSGQNDASEYSS